MLSFDNKRMTSADFPTFLAALDSAPGKVEVSLGLSTFGNLQLFGTTRGLHDLLGVQLVGSAITFLVVTAIALQPPKVLRWLRVELQKAIRFVEFGHHQAASLQSC